MNFSTISLFLHQILSSYKHRKLHQVHFYGPKAGRVDLGLEWILKNETPYFQST